MESIRFGPESGKQDASMVTQEMKGKKARSLVSKYLTQLCFTAMLDQYDFKSLSKEYQTSLEILQETEKVSSNCNIGKFNLKQHQMVPEMMQKLERAATVLDTLNVPDYEESTATPRKENHGFMDLDEPKTPKKKDGVTPKTARNGLLSHLD